VKFLIAGLGSIGRRHLRNLRALGEDDILLYRTHQSTLPDDELAGLSIETDLQAALSYHPDAVIVANPTALHMEVAIQSALAGCHLLIEKPVSNTLERVDELEAALRATGKQALVGFQFRFHPGLQQVVNLLANGELGRPLTVRAHWGEYLADWHPWEDYRQSYSARADLGGGVLLTLCHPFDYLRWILGEITSLWAFTGKLGDLELEVEDTAEIGLRFEQGLLGSLHLDYNQRPASHTLEVIGTQGTLNWSNTDGAVHWYNATGQSWHEYLLAPGFERNEMFKAEMNHFLDVVHGEAQPVCGIADGRRVIELVLAAQVSMKEKKMVDFAH